MAFPKHFYWGAATAAYQVEGGIENTDWAVAAREGKVPVCGVACDHYTRYESDFDLAKDLGHNAHRFSVEWARIEPQEGEFDQEALEHYRRVAQALRARGMEPFVTLWHFTLPQWFADRGGWDAKDSAEIFARYAGKVVEALGDICTHFSTINEPLVFSSIGWQRGDWPPFKKDGPLAVYRIARRLVRAHRAAYDACKIACDTCDVSIVKHNIYFHVNNDAPFWKKPFLHVAAALASYGWNRWFIERIKDKVDTIGINYYNHSEFGKTRVYEKTDFGWDVFPQGLRNVLGEVARYGKPIYVAEAGLADARDVQRATYIEELVRAVEGAISDGAHIRGFMYWSLLDNYEWARGFEMRFGLIEVDFETQNRTVRSSALHYKTIIERARTEAQ